MHSSDNETVLGYSCKLGGPAEHLIDGSEKRICRSTFKFYSPHVIEKRNNPLHPKSALIDFTLSLSNARRFYSSKGDP